MGWDENKMADTPDWKRVNRVFLFSRKFHGFFNHLVFMLMNKRLQWVHLVRQENILVGQKNDMASRR